MCADVADDETGPSYVTVARRVIMDALGVGDAEAQRWMVAEAGATRTTVGEVAEAVRTAVDGGAIDLP